MPRVMRRSQLRKTGNRRLPELIIDVLSPHHEHLNQRACGRATICFKKHFLFSLGRGLVCVAQTVIHDVMMVHAADLAPVALLAPPPVQGGRVIDRQHGRLL